MDIPNYKQNGKVVEIDLKEFEKFVDYVNNLKKQLQDCIKINNFLNNQIKEYNKEFTNDGKS